VPTNGATTGDGSRTRILIVEDDPELRQLLTKLLSAEGYDTEAVATSMEALAAPDADLVLIDIVLGDEDGRDLLQELRRISDVPVVFLTGRGHEMDRIAGLKMGADDYIVKPFSVPELLARIRSLLLRARPERVAAVLGAGDLELDREKKRVSRSGREVRLGPTEFRLLEFLMENPGRVYTREQLLDGVWGRDIYIDERTVDVHVGRLRRALNRGRATDPIRTVRGAGYSFDERFGKPA